MEGDLSRPLGALGYVAAFAEIMEQYIRVHGSSEEELAHVPVTFYANANENPLAQMHKVKVSVDDEGLLLAIGKKLKPEIVNGESIGMLCFRGTGPKYFRGVIERDNFVLLLVVGGLFQLGVDLSVIKLLEPGEVPPQHLVVGRHAKGGFVGDQRLPEPTRRLQRHCDVVEDSRLVRCQHIGLFKAVQGLEPITTFGSLVSPFHLISGPALIRVSGRNRSGAEHQNTPDGGCDERLVHESHVTALHIFGLPASWPAIRFHQDNSRKWSAPELSSDRPRP